MSPRKQADESGNLNETVPPCEHCEKYFFYQNATFNLFDALFLVISIGTYLLDVVTDMIVCVQYFSAPEYFWGLLTLTFMVIPSIIVHVFSARWYFLDDDMTTSDWLLHIFQLGTLKRYVCVFQTGLEARRSRDSSDFELLYHQQSDVSMLRLFESFMESAPQLVLQLYIMIATNDENYFTGVSAAVSLISLCWAIAAYSKAQRKMRIDKAHISWPGLIFQTIWRIGMVSSRIMSLVLFATIFKALIFPVVVTHWLAMFLWVYYQNTDFCLTWAEERLFNVIISIIYIFCFFNLKEGSSRFRIIAFYSVILIEDTVLVILWTIYSELNNQYNTAGYTIVFGGFFIGILSMVIYYRCFHPSGHISLSTTILKDIEKHCPHDHLYASPGSYGLDAEISFRSRSISSHKSPEDYSFNSEGNFQLNYSETSAEQSCTSGFLAAQRSISDSCLLDLTTETQTKIISSVNCLVNHQLSCELGLTFTDYRLNCTGFASILANRYDAAKERALTNSTQTQIVIEKHLLSPDDCLEESLDITQGSSLQDMPNISLQTPGLMTRYEAEKIYLDILDQQRPSVPSQRKLVFKSGEDMSEVIESKEPEQMVDVTQETSQRRYKPYILWKLENQRKSKQKAVCENLHGIAVCENHEKIAVCENHGENVCNVKGQNRQRDNIAEKNEDCPTIIDNENQDKKLELENEKVGFLGKIGDLGDKFVKVGDPKSTSNNASKSVRSSLGYSTPHQGEGNRVRKHSFKSSTYEACPIRKHSFKSVSTIEDGARRKHSFKSTSTSVDCPKRKHSFKSASTSMDCPKHRQSFKSFTKPPQSHSPNKENNSPCQPAAAINTEKMINRIYDNDKQLKTFKSPVLQSLPPNVLVHSPHPTTLSKDLISSKPCSPSVRSLQLSIFSPDKSPATTEKKGRRSLGKIPLNTVADKISIFTN